MNGSIRIALTSCANYHLLYQNRIVRLAALMIPAYLLGGCATAITEQMDRDIELVNACQEIQANQAGYVTTSKAAYIELIRKRVLGDVVRCTEGDAGTGKGPELQSVLFCGLNEELGKNVALQTAAFEDFTPLFRTEVTNIKTSVDKIKVVLNGLEDKWTKDVGRLCDRVDTCVRKYVDFMNEQDNNGAPAAIVTELKNIGAAIDRIQVLANNVEGKILAAGQQDQILLIADIKRFVVNAKSFLGTSRRALVGDVAMVTRDAVLNNVYYQLSHRILDTLDSSLERAEKVLDKADEQLYGSISLTTYFARGKIQTSLDKSVTVMVCKAANGKPPARAAFAIAQAVCERNGDPNRTVKSTLAPLLEASFVKAVHYANPPASDKKPTLEQACTDLDKKYASSSAPPGGETAGESPNDTLAFGVYMAHEWAAGLALTSVVTEKLTPQQAAIAGEVQKASMAAIPRPQHVAVIHPGAAVATGIVPNAVEGVPVTSTLQRLVATLPARDAVKHVALSSSAAAVSEFEAGRNGGDHEALGAYMVDSSSVKSVVNTFVNTQTQSVQVSVVANATQNVNVAPAAAAAPAGPSVFIVSDYVQKSQDVDLCDGTPASVSCRRYRNGSYEIIADRFNAGAFHHADLSVILDRIGRAATRSERSYEAYISGYASSSEFSCQQIAGWSTARGEGRLFPGAQVTNTGQKNYQFAYRSERGQVDAKLTCGDRRQSDGNQLLSFARAAWASHMLEKSSGAQIRVMGVVGLGANYAVITDQPDDRKIVVRLFPM